MVSVCATVEASVVMNTPFALVMPEMVPKLLRPAARQRSAAFGTDCRGRPPPSPSAWWCHTVGRHRSRGSLPKSRSPPTAGQPIEGH